MLVFVSAITTTVCGSFVGVIGGGGISLTGFGFMLVVVCIVSNEQRTVVADEVFLCVIFLRAGRDESTARGGGGCDKTFGSSGRGPHHELKLANFQPTFSPFF